MHVPLAAALLRHLMRVGLLVFLLASLAGCNGVLGPGPRDWQEVPLDARVVEGYTAFGLDLFGRIAGEHPDSNTFFSPTSAAFALSMTYNGAAASTAEEMARVLGVEGLTPEEVNENNRRWLEALVSGTGDTELSLGNSIWIRRGFPVEPDFVERNRTHYLAEVAELDFNDPASVETINRWASEQTRGKIDRVLDSIDPDHVMFLINALYFKGTWTYTFDRERTQDAPFTRLDGSTVRVPMMSQDRTFPYLRGDGFEMAALPYGNGRFRMVVALPEPGLDPAAWLGSLDPEAWRGWMAELDTTGASIEVQLPKFELEWEAELNEVLKAMGMEQAFVPGAADFSGINPALGAQGDLYVDFVKQKTYVRVDEEGTEAAAVTTVGIGVTSAPPVLRLDRPFLVAIQDRATRSILFLGWIADPLG